MSANPLESETQLRALLGAADNVWSAGTLSAFMALGQGPDSRSRLHPGVRLLAFETLGSCAAGTTASRCVCRGWRAAFPGG